MSWNEKIKKEFKYCGEQVFIGENTIFTNPENVLINDRVRIDPFCLITASLFVGSNSHICSHVVLGGGVRQSITLEGWNFIGYGSKLFTASEDYSGEFGPVCEFWGNNKTFRGDITFNLYSGVASDVMVFPRVNLPHGCAIGAKSLVRKSLCLNPWSVYYGDPLKFKRVRHYINIEDFAQDSNFLKEH